MDVSTLNSATTAASMAKTGNSAAIDALVVAKEQQKQTAQQLLSTVPEPPKANPPHLGNNIDVKA